MATWTNIVSTCHFKQTMVHPVSGAPAFLTFLRKLTRRVPRLRHFPPRMSVSGLPGPCGCINLVEVSFMNQWFLPRWVLVAAILLCVAMTGDAGFLKHRKSC